MEVTDAGFFREYEVKLTLADFKADAKKARTIFQFDAETGKGGWSKGESKHRLLAQGAPVGPSRFWYVAPEGIIPRELLPPWAGLYELRGGRWINAHEAVKAPTLHRQTLDPKVMTHARGICYYRMHDLLNLKALQTLLPYEKDPAQPKA